MQNVSRNDPCPCGSGKKFKKCCGTQAGAKKLNAQVLASDGASKISSLFSKIRVQQPSASKDSHDLPL